jgi:hypothetical protein
MLDALETLVNGHTSSTSVDERIRNHPYALVACGIDEASLVLQLSGAAAAVCERFTQHDFRARGFPGGKMVGNVSVDGFRRRLVPLCEGLILIWLPKYQTLRVRLHGERLIPVDQFAVEVEVAMFQLARVGITTMFPMRLARIDVAGDVLFSTSAGYRRARESVARSMPSHGREVRRVHHSVYVHSSGSPKAKRVLRVYDKGRERVEVGGWGAFPVERLMRLEAEVNMESGQRPEPSVVTREWARQAWQDRFGYVGAGSLAWNGGLMDRLLSLKAAGVITAAQYERLFTFLEHERVGMAGELYDRVTYLKRAREARSLDLEVPSLEERTDGDVEYELNVRELLDEIAVAL